MKRAILIGILALLSLCALTSAAWTIVSVKKNYHTEVTYFHEYNYTCPTEWFNLTTNPLHVYCWNYSVANETYNLLFEKVSPARYNISEKTVWWNVTRTTQVDDHLDNITINNNGDILDYQCSYPYHQCKRYGGMMVCDSCLNGNCNGYCDGGESCIDINISNNNLSDWKRSIRTYKELMGYGIQCAKV